MMHVLLLPKNTWRSSVLTVSQTVRPTDRPSVSCSQRPSQPNTRTRCSDHRIHRQAGRYEKKSHCTAASRSSAAERASQHHRSCVSSSRLFFFLFSLPSPPRACCCCVRSSLHSPPVFLVVLVSHGPLAIPFWHTCSRGMLLV